METSSEPKRCPECHALVVDRRSATCTTCRSALPAEWVMTAAQTDKVGKLEAAARAQHIAEMRVLDPRLNPNVPTAIKFLDMSTRI